MVPERLASIPSSSGHGAALAARTLTAEANPADYRHPQSLVTRLHAYGAHADVVVSHPRHRPTIQEYLHGAGRKGAQR